MSTSVALEEDIQRIFDERILPTVFPHPPASGEPVFMLAVGQPGASTLRATGHDLRAAVVSASDLRAFHPRHLHLSRSREPEDARVLAHATAEWLRRALQHARTTGRSLVLDGTSSTPEVATGTLRLFADSGFETTLAVVAVPRAESLLAATSKYLLDSRAGRVSHLTSVAEHDASLRGIRTLVRGMEEEPSVDRLTIVARDGTTRFDSTRIDDASFAGASAALEREQTTGMPGPLAMRWLSELRAMTGYALPARRLARPLGEALAELHEIALTEVLPGLPLPEDSQARPAAQANFEHQLRAIRRATGADRRTEQTPGPVITPPSPDRGISI